MQSFGIFPRGNFQNLCKPNEGRLAIDEKARKSFAQTFPLHPVFS